MGRPSQAWTEEKIQKRLADGLGRGIGNDYTPWLTVGRSTPSVGTSNRTGGRTTGRLHHFLSDIERNAFLLYDWAENVVDIREQFPLDRGETRAIAEAMGGRHPVYPRSRPEPLDAEALRQTAEDYLGLIQPMIAALRSGRAELIAQYDDLTPFGVYVEQVLEDALMRTGAALDLSVIDAPTLQEKTSASKTA
jgi:hypothetical protein